MKFYGLMTNTEKCIGFTLMHITIDKPLYKVDKDLNIIQEN